MFNDGGENLKITKYVGPVIIVVAPFHRYETICVYLRIDAIILQNNRFGHLETIFVDL